MNTPRCLSLPSLSGCCSATAATPDSKNPAHCIAAFAYASHLSTQNNRGGLASELMIRAEAEVQRAATGGRDCEEVIREARTFSRAFLAQNRQGLMGQLVLGCLHRQDTAMGR